MSWMGSQDHNMVKALQANEKTLSFTLSDM